MLIDLSPLKHKNFRHLFLGQTIASFGSQMTAVVIPFQVYSITNSVFYTGLVSGVEFISLFFSSLLGGVFADRFDKRKILIICELLLVFIPALLAVNAAQITPRLGIIFALAAVSSFLVGLHRPSLEALTPRLVPPEDIPKVSALTPMRHILTTILSPMLGGFLMVYWGASATYLINSATFLMSLLFLLAITGAFKAKPEVDIDQLSVLKSISQGYSYLKGRKDILGSYITDFLAMVFCNPMVLFPALAASFQKIESVGTLYALPSIGALCMTLFSRWTLQKNYYGRWIIGFALLWALSMVFVGLAGSFWMILIALFFAGYFDMVSAMFRITLWNQTIPESVRGRLAGFEMLSYSSGPLLGNALLGFLADSIGIQQALLLGSLISLTGVTLINFLLRDLWNFQIKTFK